VAYILLGNPVGLYARALGLGTNRNMTRVKLIEKWETILYIRLLNFL